MSKKEFDIDVVMDRLPTAVKPYPKAAMFELAEQGFASPFEQLVACMISIRTLDEVSLPTARRLFEQARTPEAIFDLAVDQIDHMIEKSSFHKRKAFQIHNLAQRVIDEYEGKLPCDVEILTSFDGVGVKCAHLVLGITCGQPRVSADIHVHRVTNRWGYISTPSPERTSQALEAVLPPKYWVEINRLLVPFGKHICTGSAPHCTTCPILEYCQQVGVGSHR